MTIKSMSSADALGRMIRKTVPERAGLAVTHTRDVYYGYDLRGLQGHARFDSTGGDGVTTLHDGFGRLNNYGDTILNCSSIVCHDLKSACVVDWREASGP